MPALSRPKSRFLAVVAVGLIASAAVVAGTQSASSAPPATATPIKHVVVLFQENASFDHYFGTYPNAVNAPGEIPFTPAPGTPAVDGLTPALLTANPNAGNPKRLGSADVIPTIGCANNHNYTPEQSAFNGGLMNKFVESTQGKGVCGSSGVMNYFDGNTVTGLWNYAQHYAMSDNFHGTGFGPSTIGAINLISGNTGTAAGDKTGAPLFPVSGAVNNGTVYNNLYPYADYDGCTAASSQYALDAAGAKNVGDLLNTAGVTWGWFQGGFTPTDPATPACTDGHANVSGAGLADYDAHHNPFAYYQSTSNPMHLPPTPGTAVGDPDPAGANHQYDLAYFTAAAKAGKLPAVSFVKAGHYQDGHPGYSDPVDEQTHLVNMVNAIQSSPDWASTAIIIAWDDSDGWYDHQMPTLLRKSSTPEDALSGPGVCDNPTGPSAPTTAPDRCGPGPRLPLVVLSPYAKANYVGHGQIEQASILKFIERNWSLPGIGGGSADASAASMEDLFDFTSAKNTALTLDPSTGALPGTVRLPAAPVSNPTPIPSSPAPAPAPSQNPPVVVTKTTPVVAGLGKLTCTAKRSTSKKVVLTCRAAKAVQPKTAVRARLLLKKKQLGTASATVKGTKVTITLKLKKSIARGKYTLSLSIATVGSAATAQTTTIKL